MTNDALFWLRYFDECFEDFQLQIHSDVDERLLLGVFISNCVLHAVLCAYINLGGAGLI